MRDVGKRGSLLIICLSQARLLRETCFCARNNLCSMGGQCYGEGFLIYVWEGVFVYLSIPDSYGLQLQGEPYLPTAQYLAFPYPVHRRFMRRTGSPFATSRGALYRKLPSNRRAGTLVAGLSARQS